MARVIMITSGKGGVGKTTTAVNLATALHNYGRPTVLVDLNLYSADVNLHLGAFRIKDTSHDVLSGRKKVSDVIYLHPSGLRFIPASTSMKKADEIDINKVDANIREMLDFLKERTEVIIIDAGILFTEYVRKLVDYADDVILVTTPDKESVANTLKAAKLIERKGKNILGVIVNKVENHPVELSKREIELFVEKPIIASVPLDKSVKDALRLEFPVVHYNPLAPASIKFKEAAGKLIGRKYEDYLNKEEKRSLFYKILEVIGLR